MADEIANVFLSGKLPHSHLTKFIGAEFSVTLGLMTRAIP